ncbi:UDP-2-acetamido-2,6-beta-L-arabino-hexul-4-ose reductase [Algoriphagus ratkowskyi]|uniref:SDR family oxidoreductase n=1 Tax=Algoriphagus ratkowskyi TaxID=57028 RepID=A0A2W7QP30_9BACT|nr:NAD-dependent epimerase/dehydratase family protein [Algoriphagus ratkowskyi]PZX50263.1 UDP-2-acetamido-2,6-beta-L-arabino-hexul-4-ose reductase [Algoriphagus ratkowskyi]TXD75615.1 SDR family oxidoreductase [Algoriphagus ratkowskyi]
MFKVGITGQNGFVGSHLFNSLGLYPEEFQLIIFERSWFDSSKELDLFISSCDVIVHLAALNRHDDPNEIYSRNTGLSSKLIESLERTKSTPHVILSSSTQESLGNIYGDSKKHAREELAAWADRVGASFTGMIIPNVFGPFGHPNYNSFIATFCHKIARNEKPSIHIDAEVELIYINELVNTILGIIRDNISKEELLVPFTSQSKVSSILSILNKFKEKYQDMGEIPSFASKFELDLFNTYRCYMDIENYFPRKFTQHIDPRGAFVEVIRLKTGGQVSFSTTVPEITRGNHFHTRKIERFAVIKGRALIQLRRIGTQEVLNFELNGNEPAYVDMPIWYTHNIKNIGEEELLTIFWINEHYDPKDPDTFFVEV